MATEELPTWTAGAGRQSAHLLTSAVNAIRQKTELGDALIFLYLVAFVRQCLWLIDEQSMAWVLTLLGATLIWLGHLLTKEREAKLPLQFWLVVALPLLAIYALRIAFPDGSFDVLNYRLMHAERALRGLLLTPGDFFPTPAPYNPTPDIITGITRHLLGYRLGTLVNYLALLWAGAILDKLLRPFIKSDWLRCGGIFLVVCAEHLLFEINNYMVDLLSVPLMLEAVRLALRAGAAEHEGRNAARVAVLLGASVAFKFTALAVALPVAVFYAYRLLASGRLRFNVAGARLLLIAVVAFALPLLPFTLYIYYETGSPVFPLYNGLFRSPYWPLSSGWDERWGPKGVWETLLWPLLLPFRAERLAELPVYSGRITAGCIAALCFLFWRGIDRNLRALGIIFLAAALLWSMGIGYIRYGFAQEILGGALLLALAARLAHRDQRSGARARMVLGVLLWGALAFQSALAFVYTTRYEWSMRPTALGNFPAYRAEARYLLRDRSLSAFLPARERELFAGVEVWIESSIKTNGIATLLRPDIPMLGVRMHEFFVNAEGRARFNRALQAQQGKRMFSLCIPEDLRDCLDAITRRDFAVGQMQRVSLPFYSRHTVFNMMLIEVLPPGQGLSRESLGFLPTEAALPDAAYRAQLTALSPPMALRAGERAVLLVRVKNESATVWPARGRESDGRFRVTVGNIWLADEGRRVVNNLDGRSNFPADLRPGAEATIPLTITAPRAPGDYVMMVDVVQEGVAWFSERGSEPLRLRLRVAP